MTRLGQVAGILLGALLITRLKIRDHRHRRVPQPADAILVFGAALWHDGPSWALMERLGHAVDLYTTGLAPHIACYGGRQEVHAMGEYLLSRSVPADAITLEPRGTTTRRTVSAIREHDQWESVIAVSSFYHLHRIMAECHRQGIKAQPSPPAPPRRTWRTPRIHMFLERQYLRETAAIWFYWLTRPRRLWPGRG